ncbi:hypothetical protein [Oryza sativa Japonica Group]|uniref:Uncharacterized protein n=2 Tax=Oryza sativa TaxID=4530 RepID=Q5JKZ4_ORYSJ|nr:hypothetical protein OsI_05239 [Oryza sativa Indica Group]EAZ14865.1 hypothetical protein OsJ_04793 [Oryza sativa Japonica Group]BAD87863.1 hypothetical protein [Oryza sativa Japonica Group]
MGQQLAAKQKGSFHAWSQIQRNSINGQKAVKWLERESSAPHSKSQDGVQCADGEEWRRSEQMSRTEKAEELAFLVAFTLKKLKKY